ncbi:MAG: nicotinate (nicotinamide) nucleotide adenylyltransferase [Eubacterium sp.]|jgi:nicotinate-nucleotide adenylyltransferase|nr:nicotinate (nicotinamide) nucleotide adenylyltransferase [Eubacterium sp.]
MPIKLGIYGGSFNPPHKGHLNVASFAIDNLNLNKLLIVPNGIPPHKKSGDISFDHRFKMCEQTFFLLGKETEISDIEGKIKGKSYTINTVRAIKSLYPLAETYLIVGSDMLFSFREWHEYKKLLNECCVVVAARNVAERKKIEKAVVELGKVIILDIEAMPMSSSEIREKIREGSEVSGYLTVETMRYIEVNQLYRGG